MKLIIISPSGNLPREKERVISLLENGLEIFHVHKPNFSEQEIQNYIQQFPTKYQIKIFRHSDFPKFHSLEELKNHKKKFEYAFLSPIFDSISKIGYKSNFNLQEVKFFLQKQKAPSNGEGWGEVIALGGIDEDKTETCRQLGFAGIAVCGAVWQSKNPLEKFLRLKSLCQKKDLVF